MVIDSIEHNKLLGQPFTCGIYKLLASIMIAVYLGASKLSMDFKQYLNELSGMHKLLKALSNSNSDSKRHVSMYNNLNASSAIRDVDERGLIKHMWEANYYREKGMQPHEEQFVS